MKVKMGTVRRGVRFQKERREWKLPGILYEDDMVLCGESEEDVRAMVERFVEIVGEQVCKSIKVRAR